MPSPISRCDLPVPRSPSGAGSSVGTVSRSKSAISLSRGKRASWMRRSRRRASRSSSSALSTSARYARWVSRSRSAASARAAACWLTVGSAPPGLSLRPATPPPARSRASSSRARGEQRVVAGQAQGRASMATSAGATEPIRSIASSAACTEAEGQWSSTSSSAPLRARRSWRAIPRPAAVAENRRPE